MMLVAKGRTRSRAMLTYFILLRYTQTQTQHKPICVRVCGLLTHVVNSFTCVYLYQSYHIFEYSMYKSLDSWVFMPISHEIRLFSLSYDEPYTHTIVVVVVD